LEVPNYGPIYGPVTNGTTNGTGTGLIGAALASLNFRNSNSLQGYISSIDDSSNYLQTIETLKEENEALKNKLDLLEIQFKFLLNKFTELEKFMGNRE
jgi:coproporphyrinogen III oxidase-like Fe-S oxidoreductase